MVIAVFYVARGDLGSSDLVAYYCDFEDELELEREFTILQVLFSSSLNIAALSPDRSCRIMVGKRELLVYLGEVLGVMIWREKVPFTHNFLREAVKWLEDLYSRGELRPEVLAVFEYLTGDFNLRILEYCTSQVDFRDPHIKLHLRDYLSIVSYDLGIPYREEYCEVLQQLPTSVVRLLRDCPVPEFVELLLYLLERGVLVVTKRC